MKKIKAVLVLLFSVTVVLLTAVPGIAQQLPQYSQYIFNGLHINPGYAGYKQAGDIQSTYRNQWVGFPGAPKTMTFTADFSANDASMGFGLSLVNDRLGPTESNIALFSYSYRIQLGYESFLGLGVSVGASQYSLDPNKLRAIDEVDDLIPEGKVNLFTPNFNAGLFFNTENFYAGLSAYNMSGRKVVEREDISLSFHDFHYFLTSGVLIPLSYDLEFKPSFLVKQVHGSPLNYDINAMFLFYETLWLGASYRSNVHVWNDNLQGGLTHRNALAFVFELYLDSKFRIGYAYDHNLNVLQNYRNNSHEISLGYYLFHRRSIMRNPRWL